MVSGWGWTFNSTKNQDILRWVEVKIVPNSLCEEHYEPKRITSSILCATNNSSGLCHADNGGGLFLQTDRRDLQIGVASFCSSSCTDETPAAYTKLVSYIGWINRIAEIQDE
ncbi:chymotrypsinogen B2-like [Schistocerca americana]|nr:chymotrypsinogen B2-like [Schistocerca americana]